MHITGRHATDRGRALRPYQREAIASLVRGFRTWQRLVLSLPTGTGKTFTAATFLRDHLLGRGKRVLWVAHSKELLDQAYETFLSLGFGEDEVGRRYACFKEDQRRKPGARLWIVNNLIRSRPCDQVDCIVFDEAHHADGTSYKRWLSAFGVAEEGGPTVLGLTATPYRRCGGEVLPLTSDVFCFSSRPSLPVFQLVAYERSFAQLAAEGYLAPFKHIPVDTRMAFRLEWDPRLRDFRQASLSQLDTGERNDFIYDLWSRNRRRFGKTLIFVGTQEHAARLAARFGSSGGYVVSSMDSESRDAVMREFKDGALDVLVNVGIFKEGVDVPHIRTVMLARPTASPILFTQMVGRGARLCQARNKRFFYLVDVHDQLDIYDGYLMGISDLAEGDADLCALIEAKAEQAEQMEQLNSAGVASPGASVAEEDRTLEPGRKKRPRRAPPVSLSAREVQDYCGWVCFEDERGIASKVAMFLTRTDLEALMAAADARGRLRLEAAGRLAALPAPSAAIRRSRSALERGLRGTVQCFPEDPEHAARLVDELRGLTEATMRDERERELVERGFKERLEANARELGLPCHTAEALWSRLLEGEETCGGVLPVPDESHPRLLLLTPGTVECLRRAVNARRAEPYNFEQALDWLDEAVRIEPGLALCYRHIVRAMRNARSIDDVCLVAA